MTKRKSNLRFTEFLALANPEIATKLIEACDGVHLERVRANAERSPSRFFANALTNHAWRNGPVEDIHAGTFCGYPLDQRRMSLQEERELMSFASEWLALGMQVCRQFSNEEPARPWSEQVVPYGLASMLLVTPSRWTRSRRARYACWFRSENRRISVERRDPLPHKVQKDGADIGTRRALNLVQGARVSLDAADDPANDRVSVIVGASPPEVGEITNALGYVPADRAGDHFTGAIDCGPHQTVGGPLENMAKYSEDFSAATWDKNGGSCSVTSNAIIAPDGNQTADVITAVTTTPVIQQQIAGLADGGTYTFYTWARVPSGTRKLSLAIVNSAYAAYLAGLTQVTPTTSWQRFKITGTLASGQAGLWIVVRQYAGNGDDWTTGDIHLWGACLQQGDNPQAAYARTWASQTPHTSSGVAAGPTVIAAPDSTASPLKIHGPASNLADSALLELTANGELILAGGSGNGYRFADLGSANNPSGWAGVLKVKTPAGTTLGYILLYSNP